MKVPGNPSVPVNWAFLGKRVKQTADRTVGPTTG
jgi:hypothetical protein